MARVYAAVKALITHNNKYLILETGSGKQQLIDLPGGKIEYSKTPEQALLREIREETDLDVEIISLVGLWWFFLRKEEGQVVCMTYLCKPKSLEIDIDKNPADEDITGFGWLAKEDILKLDNFPDESLRDLFVGLS